MRGTVNSVPEIHTELSATNPLKHEIDIILPPETGKIYDGVMAYSASTDVAPATLIVPVNSTEIKDQLAAAMDGKKFYAITTEDHEHRIGTWQFAGNVLTIHNNKPIPFNVNYTVIYRELEPSKNNKIGTIQSIPSTLLGNNSEHLAVIIPSSTTNQYSGKLSYTASQNVLLYSSVLSSFSSLKLFPVAVGCLSNFLFYCRMCWNSIARRTKFTLELLVTKFLVCSPYAYWSMFAVCVPVFYVPSA